MRKLFTQSAIALAVVLASCSHGGVDSTPPVSRTSNAESQILQKKMQREQTRVTSAFVAKKHPGFMAETPDTQRWQTGIREAGRAPVPGGMFSIENQYNTLVNGQRVTVYAGSLRTTGAGIILVVRRSSNFHAATTSMMTVGPNPVRIQSATGAQVQLQEIGRISSAASFRVPL